MNCGRDVSTAALPFLKPSQKTKSNSAKPAPFAHIHVSLACDAERAKWHLSHFLRKEVIVTCIAIGLSPKVFDDPRLIDLPKAFSSTLGVFYSELRRTECSLRAWFWTGIWTQSQSL